MPQPRRTDEQSGVLINFRVTAEERERLKEAAKANFQTLSEFVRAASGDAASETLEDDAGNSEP